jgi:hypothetical protein
MMWQPCRRPPALSQGMIAYTFAVASDDVSSKFCERSQSLKSPVHAWQKSKSSSFWAYSSPATNFKTLKLLVVVSPQRLHFTVTILDI